MLGTVKKPCIVPELTGFTIVMEYNSSDRKEAESTYKNMSHTKGLPSSFFAPDSDQKWRSGKSRRKKTQYFPRVFYQLLIMDVTVPVFLNTDYCTKRTKINSKSQCFQMTKLKYSLTNIYIDPQKHFHILHQSLWKTLIKSTNSVFSEQKHIAVIVDIGM